MTGATPKADYGLASIPADQQCVAPKLDYLPRLPASGTYPIGLIGAGGISEYHLRAYQKLGLRVVAICDVELARAEQRRLDFYPEARTCSDYRQVLEMPEVQVVDVATHPAERVAIVTEAIRRGKHVLSQKPFVTDLDTGERLVELAEQHQVRLAVNQNGRWAPHFSYLAAAVRQQLIGRVSSVDFVLHWDHTWTASTPFNEIHHLLLYDFGIHWFDMANLLMGDRSAQLVFAAVQHTGYQTARPPFLANCLINYDDAQVRLCFNAHVQYGQEDRTIVAGELGTLRACGPGLNDQSVQIWTSQGQASPELHGCWFENGFQGTMSELQCAIAEGREPVNSARHNLRSLELCFAALASADRAEAVRPGSVRRLPNSPIAPA